MKRYVMMQAPSRGDYVGKIEVVDNSSERGKRVVQRLVNDGYVHIGWIESEKPTTYFKHGFCTVMEERADNAKRLLKESLEFLVN